MSEPTLLDDTGKIREDDLSPHDDPTEPPKSVSARLANLGKAMPDAGRTTPLPHVCGRCEQRWAGSRTAHCGACHITSTAVEGFDDHRRGGACWPPETVGLILAEGRAYEAWRRPSEVGYE